MPEHAIEWTPSHEQSAANEQQFDAPTCKKVDSEPSDQPNAEHVLELFDSLSRYG